VTPARRTVVKVCGLTRAEDARHALECGADWLGFIVEAWGPRQVGAPGMAAIVAALPPGTVTVAVLGGVTPDRALELARAARATRVQLLRADPGTWPAGFPLPCAFVTGMDAEGRPTGPLAPPPHLVHLDTAGPRGAGGTGLAFPWARARETVGDREFMLAGGLDDSNVSEALAVAAPFGVDASSRLESAPGIKDAGKVRRFVAAVREHDARNVRPA
jgi:phosphoribosylanthranilate isomerase